jgi:O-acetyl-ADP-ribose deacetylase (regulator of RNase III)
MAGRIELVEGDITEQEVDAIVNAANSALVLGAGVAGAIASKGGPSIQRECDAHGAIEVGGAAITGAGDLPARYVIHAAGMSPGGQADEQSVRSSVRRSLELAHEHGLVSVAFPAIGAGIGGFSLQRCAEVSIEEAREHLAGETSHDAAKVAAQMARLEGR